MTLPNITNKQYTILYYLYTFRFLNTHQIQLLLQHKLPTRIQSWLKDLSDKGYIEKQSVGNSFVDRTKPAVYFLSTRARRALKTQKEVNVLELNRLYKEKLKGKKFIDQCLFIADCYLFFLSQKTDNESLHFFTQARLRQFDYFPDPLPSAYIAVKTSDKTRRYFLDVFDAYTPAWVLRKRLKIYITYCESRNWEENTDSSSFPIILFVCPNERMKKHIFWYGKSVIEKSYEDISLFVTTKDIILVRQDKNIWQKVA